VKQIRTIVPALSGVALVVVLRKRVVLPATDADIATPPLQRRAFDDDLRDQLQALRTAQSEQTRCRQA
jgi:hypothetical protein